MQHQIGNRNNMQDGQVLGQAFVIPPQARELRQTKPRSIPRVAT